MASGLVHRHPDKKSELCSECSSAVTGDTGLLFVFLAVFIIQGMCLALLLPASPLRASFSGEIHRPDDSCFRNIPGNVSCLQDNTRPRHNIRQSGSVRRQHALRLRSSFFPVLKNCIQRLLCRKGNIEYDAVYPLLRHLFI